MRQISLTNNPYQSFVFTLNDLELRIIISWNDTASKWAFDLYNNNSGDLILGGGAIVSGVNIFEGAYPYDLEAYFITKQGVIKDPTRDELFYGYLFVGDPNVI